MNLTLAQLTPLACTLAAGIAMVRIGAAKNMLVIRAPRRCAACGVERRACRCDA
jgi:hypothetical protein